MAPHLSERVSRLVIVRHAHRDKTMGSWGDDGLSDKGNEQVRALTAHLIHLTKGIVPAVATSPKLRCVETLVPYAKAVGRRLKKDDLLIEQGPKEDFTTLERRVAEFLALWKTKAKPLTVICTHGDWIPVATLNLLDRSVDLKKSGVAVIDREGEKCVLKKIL